MPTVIIIIIIIIIIIVAIMLTIIMIIGATGSLSWAIQGVWNASLINTPTQNYN
jgi:hypothetical protein